MTREKNTKKKFPNDVIIFHNTKNRLKMEILIDQCSLTSNKRMEGVETGRLVKQIGKEPRGGVRGFRQ